MYFEYTLVQRMHAMNQRQIDVYTSLFVVRGCIFLCRGDGPYVLPSYNSQFGLTQLKPVVRDITRDQTGNRHMCI